MATTQTQATRNILSGVEVALQGAYRPAIMLDNILDKAQSLVNTDGYAWDVALAIACKIYPATAHCGKAAYA